MYGDAPVTLSVSATTTSSPSNDGFAPLFDPAGAAEARYLNDLSLTTSDTTKLPL